MLSQKQTEIYERAVSAMGMMLNAGGASSGMIKLYGPNGKPLAPSSGGYTYQRSGAKRAGSMKNWRPRKTGGQVQEAMEREALTARAIDLVQNDPNAAGAVDGIAQAVIGAGLTPQPLIDHDAFYSIDKEEAKTIQRQQRNIYKTWAPFADAGGRLNNGAIQFLLLCNTLEYGEYLVLLPMLDDPTRPYSLAVQVLNPLRLKTPLDLVGKRNIRDGVELGEYGEAKAYWIKKSDALNPDKYTADVSRNFLRIPRKQGHRLNVLHGFVCKEPEQVRGVTFFAPAMKLFRDLNDYLDAELVSNIVTAAFSLFIETGAADDPSIYAKMLANSTLDYTDADGNAKQERYQEMIPGQVMYGAAGQKPHPIAANRPGATFEPFTRLIKKTLSMALGVPYPVLFRDPEKVNFAGFRSAMLDAWRVFMNYRSFIGQGYCQPVFTMLMEEAWLKNQIDHIDDFYENMWALTRADWRGAPKGDIEPVKAAQADVLLIKNKLKSRGEAITERGGDRSAVFEELAEENEDLLSKNLDPSCDESAVNIEKEQTDEAD